MVKTISKSVIVRDHANGDWAETIVIHCSLVAYWHFARPEMESSVKIFREEDT